MTRGGEERGDAGRAGKGDAGRAGKGDGTARDEQGRGNYTADWRCDVSAQMTHLRCQTSRGWSDGTTPVGRNIHTTRTQ